MSYGDLLDDHRDRLKDTVIWNVEQGRALTGPDIGRAARLRSEIYRRVHDFFRPNTHFSCFPSPRFPRSRLDVPYPTEINGTPMSTYIEWMRTCSRITVTGHPAISVPAGFTADGLRSDCRSSGAPATTGACSTRARLRECDQSLPPPTSFDR